MFCGARFKGVANCLLSIGVFYSFLALALLFTPLVIGFVVFDVVQQKTTKNKT
jgi:hypothetical protein